MSDETNAKDGLRSGLTEYETRKRVWAAKIADAKHYPDGSATIFFTTDPMGERRTMSPEWVARHRPAEGYFFSGYYVVYPDGYSSWSPAEAFEPFATVVGGGGDLNPAAPAGCPFSGTHNVIGRTPEEDAAREAKFLRQQCIDFAIRHAPAGEAQERTLARAKAFEDYIAGVGFRSLFDVMSDIVQAAARSGE